MRLKRHSRLVCFAVLAAITLGSVSLSAQEAQSRFEHGGAQIFYRVFGSGPPLLLLHGFFGTGDLWVPFLDELSASYRVIVPDMRGHGRSTNPSSRFLHRDSARDNCGAFAETLLAAGLGDAGRGFKKKE